jgi:hypothetical protein
MAFSVEQQPEVAVMIAAIAIMDREWSYNGRPERSRACTLR